MSWLEEAARNGFSCAAQFRNDPLLAAIAGSPSFERLVAGLEDERERYRQLYRAVAARELKAPRREMRPSDEPVSPA